MLKKKRSLYLLLISSLSVSALAKQQVSILQADGPNQGLSPHALIKVFAGNHPIESPNLYPENHPGVPHIYEATDDIVGHHFVFLLK